MSTAIKPKRGRPIGSTGRQFSPKYKTAGVVSFDSSPLGDWISVRRKELKLTQAQLASAIGASQTHVCHLENGYTWNISYLEMHLLSKALTPPGVEESSTFAEVVSALHATREQRARHGAILISTEPLGMMRVAPSGDDPESQARVLVTGEGRVFTTPGEIPDSGIEIDPSTLPVLGDDGLEGSSYD